MNSDDVIRMARESGFGVGHAEAAGDLFAHFAALVASAEREECAKVLVTLKQATPQADSQPAPDEILNMAREQGLPETETEGVFRVNVDDLGRMFAADRAARAPADSVTAPAAYSRNLEQELAMLIRRIVSSARRNCEDGSNVLKLANEAWAYLVRKGLNGSPLRDAGIESDPTPPAQAADSVLEDAARLDWLALAGPTSICVVIDREHDGEVEVSTDDVTGYGKTLREALDKARKQGANHD